MNHIRHLTDDQIERYVQQSNDFSEHGPFAAHLAECEPCRSRLLEAERNSLGLRGPVKRHVAASDTCPPEDELQAFAAGVCNAGDVARILGHVADCDYCAPLLQEHLAAIEEDLELEEEPQSDPDPNPSPSPSVDLRKNTGLKKMSSVFETISEAYRLRPVIARVSLAGAAVLCAGIFALPPAFNSYMLYKADTSISAAAQEAPFKMRLNWAPHPQAALLKDPTKAPSAADNPALSVAAGLAANKQNLIDARWIRFRGRVKLVLGEYEDSAKLLQLATEMGLNDPETELDLAVADFQRDTLSESLELLAKILKNPKLSPNQRAMATFDLAMVYQQMQSWDQAVLTWEKYLELDPAGAWHDDAQRSLEEAKKKIHPPKPQGYRSPDFFLQHFSDPTVLAGLEEYVDIALREWLPAIDNKDSREASLAFGKLGQLMQDQHADPWVRDFLLARRAGDGPALIALSEAVRNNKIGWYGKASHQAQEAENLFAAVQHRPGQLRARFEAVYADQRLLQQKNCLKNAQALDESLLHTQYQWLRAQTAMELAACMNFANRTQDAQGQITKAQQIAIASNFPLVILRVQGWDAGINISDKGCESTVWNKTRVGLAQYWQGPSFPLRLYDFYSYLKLCSQKKKLWYAAELFERRMITILEKEIDRKDENPSLEVTAHRSLEQILKELDEPDEAADEARLALQLLGRMEPDIVVKYSSQIKFELADLQLDRNDEEAAWATIHEVEKEVRGTDKLLITFLRIRGDVNYRRQLLRDAEKDYQQGIEIAESAMLVKQTEEQRRSWMEENGDLYRGLAQVYVQQNREQEALQLWEWYQTRSFTADDKLGEPNGRPKWSDIERSVLNQPLPSGETARLVYVSTRDKLLVWTFDASGMKTAAIPVKREDLRRRVREYVGKIGREQRPELPLPAPEAESKELFALVLQPVLADLPGHDPAVNPVVVDFDPAMSALPVEALMSAEGWYFGQRYPVVYSSGFIRENQLRKYSQPASGLIINALGNKAAVDKFKQAIPGAVELDADGPAEEQAQSQSFIFIGHGKSGALLLANGKPLKAENFPQQSLANMQLAVLVACSSGVAREGLLDTGSLVHAFQSGGTPAVVASQWNVATDFTEQFMDSFVSNLKKGDSPAHALFAARKQLFRVQPHPYYWAAFTLSGRP